MSNISTFIIWISYLVKISLGLTFRTTNVMLDVAFKISLTRSIITFHQSLFHAVLGRPICACCGWNNCSSGHKLPVAGSCHQEYVGSVSTGVGHELTHFIDRLIVVDWSHIIVQNVFVVCFDKRNLHRDEIKIQL